MVTSQCRDSPRTNRDRQVGLTTVEGRSPRRLPAWHFRPAGRAWRCGMSVLGHELGPDRILVQFNRRQNPARVSFRTGLALVDPATGQVVKRSGVLDVGERLTISPDHRRAVAGLFYGIYRTEGGGIGYSGRGTTYATTLVDLAQLRLV